MRLLNPLLVLGLLAASSRAGDDSPAFLSRARALAEKGEVEAAILILHSNVEASALSTAQIVAAHIELAGLYTRLGDQPRAISEYYRAVEADPRSVEPRIKLGAALQQGGDLAGAVLELERAVSLCPTCPEAVSNLAQSLLDRGDIGQAIVYWRQLVSLQPDSGVAHENLGYALLRGDRLQEALREMRAAVRLSPRLASAHFYLAEALARDGQPQLALPEYRIAAHLDPRVVEFQVKYGAALVEVQPLEAVAQLRKAVELDPDNYVAHQAFGIALRKAGDLSKARSQFQRARELATTEAKLAEAKVHVNKGLQLLGSGDVVGAMEALQRALTVKPDFGAAHHYLGVALGAIGKWQDAGDAFAAALNADPSDPEIHYNFGVVLKHQGDWYGAAREFTSVTQVNSRHPQAWCALADALVKVGEGAQAQEALRRAQQLGACAVNAPR